MDETHSIHRLTAVATIATVLCACGQSVQVETMEPWPLTVETATLSCEPAEIPPGIDAAARETLQQHGGRVFVTTPDGRRFAVNGTARSEAPPVEAIQAELEMHPLIQRGLELCKSGVRSVQLAAPTPRQPEMEEAVPPPGHSVEPAQYGGGHTYRIEAEQVVRGERPALTLACGRERAPMVMFDLVRSPATPPPLRGVYASIRVDEAEAVRYEMSWGTSAIWTLRSGDERELDQQLARQLAGGERLTLTGDGRYMGSEALTFNLMGFSEEERQSFTVECR